ncbi:MAG: methionyl-tRNA formyltransferase [Urechidicola sp.]|jgi:methionyl-tRNA formyltransferase
MSVMKINVFAHNKPWGRKSYDDLNKKVPGDWVFISSQAELDNLDLTSIETIFFCHWSNLVSKEILQKVRCICFHMTDLPYGRGGSPLQNLILQGKTKTILSAIEMEESLDTGPIFWQLEVDLSGNAESIYERMTDACWMGISSILSECPTARPQVGSVVNFKRRTAEESELPKDLPIDKVYDYIRMLDAPGYPNAFLLANNIKITFNNSRLDNGKVIAQAIIEVTNEE